MGLTAEDIERGKQRLNKYYTMELKGVRKAFGVYLRGLLDSVLAKNEGKTKLIYGRLINSGIELIRCFKCGDYSIEHFKKYAILSNRKVPVQNSITNEVRTLSENVGNKKGGGNGGS